MKLFTVLFIVLFVGKNVLSEVHRIMSPSTSRVGYNSSSRSISTLVRSSQIDRKPGRKGKLKAAEEKYRCKKKAKVSTATFQKKVVVFDYMGSKSPNAFTRAEKFISVRGLLPSLPVDSSECEIRSEICEVIKSNSSTDDPEVGPDDFEFINVTGKQASIPHCKEGFEWDGRSVKELAGSGSVYVRLTKRMRYEISSSSDPEECPPAFDSIPRNARTSLSVSLSSGSSVSRSDVPLSSGGSASRSDVSLSSSGSASRSDVSLSSGGSASRDVSLSSGGSASRSDVSLSSGGSVSRSAVPLSSGGSVFQSDVSLSSGSNVPIRYTSSSLFPPLIDNGSGSSSSGTANRNDSFEPGFLIEHEVAEVNPRKDISRLVEMFPNYSPSQLEFLYRLSNSSFSRVVDSALEGLCFESLRSLAVSQLVVPLSESPRIRLDADDDEDDWVEAAVCFYKHSKFDKCAPVRISIRGQPAIDTGGVRRQFFSVVFSKLAEPSCAMCLFEGPPNRLRPAYKASLLSSGLLTIFGTMVAHSFLLDGQGFPFIAEYCFYYLAGLHDQATTCISIEDVGADVKSILTEVQTVFIILICVLYLVITTIMYGIK